MKRGDLVEIIDHGGYYSTDPPRIGLIVGPIPSWSTTRSALNVTKNLY